MEELIARIEAASGPDRELDGDIAELTGAVPGWVSMGRRNFSTWSSGRDSWDAPRYTVSLDDAMTLVPAGWKSGVEQAGAYDGSSLDEAWCWPFESHFDPDWKNGQQGYRDASDGTRGYAATPALALCAAALRARAV